MTSVQEPPLWRRGEGAFEDVESAMWWRFKRECPVHLVRALSKGGDGQSLNVGAKYRSKDGYEYYAKEVRRSTDNKLMQLVERRLIKDPIVDTVQDDEELAHQSILRNMSKALEENATLRTRIDQAAGITLPEKPHLASEELKVKKPEYVDILLQRSYESKQPAIEVERAKLTALLMINDILKEILQEQRKIANQWFDFNTHIERFGFR